MSATGGDGGWARRRRRCLRHGGVAAVSAARDCASRPQSRTHADQGQGDHPALCSPTCRSLPCSSSSPAISSAGPSVLVHAGGSAQLRAHRQRIHGHAWACAGRCAAAVRDAWALMHGHQATHGHQSMHGHRRMGMRRPLCCPSARRASWLLLGWWRPHAARRLQCRQCWRPPALHAAAAPAAAPHSPSLRLPAPRQPCPCSLARQWPRLPVPAPAGGSGREAGRSTALQPGHRWHARLGAQGRP